MSKVILPFTVVFRTIRVLEHTLSIFGIFSERAVVCGAILIPKHAKSMLLSHVPLAIIARIIFWPLIVSLPMDFILVPISNVRAAVVILHLPKSLHSTINEEAMINILIRELHNTQALDSVTFVRAFKLSAILPRTLALSMLLILNPLACVSLSAIAFVLSYFSLAMA